MYIVRKAATLLRLAYAKLQTGGLVGLWFKLSLLHNILFWDGVHADDI